MVFRIPFRFAVAAIVALLLLAVPSIALAQSVTILQSASLPRVDENGTQINKRAANLNPEGVSFADCAANQKIRFSYTLSSPAAGASFEAWASASADCGVQTNRSSATATCWRLVDGSIPLQATGSVDIPVRRIMSGVLNPLAPVSDQSICGKVDLSTIQVQFLYFAPGQLATPAAKATPDISISVDTVGPPSVGAIKVLPGNQRLVISWTTTEAGVTVQTGTKAYCDPSPVQEGSTTTRTVCEAGTAASDAGTDADADADAEAGTDAGTGQVCEEQTIVTSDAGASDNENCTSVAFAPGGDKKVVPDNAFNQKYECGSLSQGTSATIEATSLAGQPLVNGRRYAVAVGATDNFLNVGELSSVVCEYPEETSDFWTDYKNAGGDAGGGFCSVESPGASVGSLGIVASAGIVVLSVARRRKTRAGKASVGKRT